jgi:hypothetical protein
VGAHIVRNIIGVAFGVGTGDPLRDAGVGVGDDFNVRIGLDPDGRVGSRHGRVGPGMLVILGGGAEVLVLRVLLLSICER